MILMFLLSSLIQVALAGPVVPKVYLDYWNGTSERTYNNNCYNYSTNRATNSFAQPGEASNKEYQNLICSEVLAAAASDLGLVPTDFFEFNQKNDETLIALVVAPNHDYHWYRRDDNGKWSHKPGATPATTLDNSDHEITSPETADRGYYTDFCGYFRIKNFIHSEDEQNSGYVRIGNMKSLPPPDSPSEVQILMYSGRRNPAFKLSDLKSKPSLKAIFKEASFQIQQAVNLNHLLSFTPEPSRLGYQGIQIIDREGLLADKGSRIHFLNGKVTVQSPDSVVSFQSDTFKKLEAAVLKAYW